MSDGIPPIDADNGEEIADKIAKKVEAAEYELLTTESKLKELSYREINQRYWLRVCAVTVGVATILGMSALLYHMTHKIFIGPFLVVPASYSIALLIAPIASITTITVFLFMGAFKKFDESEMTPSGIPSAVGNTAKTYSSIG